MWGVIRSHPVTSTRIIFKAKFVNEEKRCTSIYTARLETGKECEANILYLKYKLI
jgi:hypothetical protein